MIKKKKQILIMSFIFIMSLLIIISSLFFLFPSQKEALIKGFSSVWDTRKPGISNENQISLPLESSGTYNFTVDWGDGTLEEITSWDQPETIHTYTSGGIYTISINGIIVGWNFNNGGDRLKLKEINKWGSLRLGNSGGYFYGCENLIINTHDNLNLTGTINLNNAFKACLSIENIEGMNNWDLSCVINMNSIFYDASSFNQNLGNWNVSNVKKMSHMFWGASSFNQDICKWNVSKVTNMSYMFWGASSFNQDIGNWDVSNVIDMSNMFSFANSFNQDINLWNVSKVTNMSYMFLQATTFNQSICNWNVSSVMDMKSMFWSAYSFNQDIGNWDVSNVIDMSNMFRISSFNQDIGNWDVSCVKDMNSMFSLTINFNQNLGNWNVSNVKDMSHMFNGVTLSTVNYDSLLIGWANFSPLQYNVNFDAGGSTFTSSGAAENARNDILVNMFNWIISDGGGV
ncbi:MAG: DUF285 domain-containing protein [Candidatus Lokiarchaeota archaeon]|nr:DUF285 domain-containing protein [Candidatus Lokiarchaeota archaeon]